MGGGFFYSVEEEKKWRGKGERNTAEAQLLPPFFLKKIWWIAGLVYRKKECVRAKILCAIGLFRLVSSRVLKVEGVWVGTFIFEKRIVKIYSKFIKLAVGA